MGSTEPRTTVVGAARLEPKMSWEWDPGQTVGDPGHQKLAGLKLREPFLGPMVVELIDFARGN
jgi:hypothetical protein